jgi:hypothetical protein
MFIYFYSSVNMCPIAFVIELVFILGDGNKTLNILKI